MAGTFRLTAPEAAERDLHEAAARILDLELRPPVVRNGQFAAVRQCDRMCEPARWWNTGAGSDRNAGASSIMAKIVMPPRGVGVQLGAPRRKATINYHHWTTKDDAIVRDAYTHGATAQQIAVCLGVSEAAITNRARILGLRHRRMTRSLEQRFFDQVSPEPNSGCWLWEGSRDRKGYGQIRIAGRGPGSLRYATHVSLELHGIPVPAGKFAYHRCDVPGCVNPEHLFIGTALNNTADMMAKGRASKPPRSKPGTGRKDICLRGHPMAGDNLWIGERSRHCRACGRIRKAARRANFVAAGLRCDGLPRAPT